MESRRSKLIMIVGLGIPAFVPFSIQITNFFLIAYFVLSFATADLSALKNNIRLNKTRILVNIAPFLFCVLSLIYTSSLSDGSFAIEKYLPLLALPLIFFSRDSIDYKWFLYTFSFSIFALCLISFLFNSYHFFVLHDNTALVGDDYNHIITSWNAFADENLVRPFDISPIYLSLYISFSLMVFYFYFSRSAIIISIQLFLLVYIILLGSRIGLAALLVTAFMLFFKISKKSLKYYYGILSVSALLIISVLLNPILKKRYIEDFNFSFPSDVSGWNAVNLRLSIWKCSMESFLKKPFIGYGTGGQWTVRDNCYQSNSWYGHFGGINLNSHNQYLEYLLIGGGALFGLFIIQLLYSLRYAIKNNDILHLGFLITFIVVCCGESLLERHMGIVFFSLFNSIFLLPKNSLQ